MALRRGVDWRGFYVGGYIAGDRGVWTVDFSRAGHGSAEESFDGLGFGAYAGYNVAFAPNFIAGIEADLGTTNASARRADLRRE